MKSSLKTIIGLALALVLSLGFFAQDGFCREGKIFSDYYGASYWLVKDNPLDSFRVVVGLSSDSAAQATVYGQALGAYRNGGVMLSVEKTGTAAVDSFTCWTATGNVILTYLGFEIVTAAAQADLVNFVLDYSPGTKIVRLGEGKDLNALTATSSQFLGLATISNVLTDSLAWISGVAATTSAFVMTATPFRIFIPDGTTIKIVFPGTNAAALAKVRVDCVWYPAEKGAKLQ